MPAHRVYLVRHAKAEPQAADDASRRLTPAGRLRFSRLLGALRDQLQITRILTSPLVRARETAELLAGTTAAPVEQDPRLAPGCSGGRQLLALTREAPAGTALVGHNPEIAEVLAGLTDRQLEVSPGAVAALDVDGGQVRLAWLELPGKG